MKKILFLFLLLPLIGFAQLDQTPIVVNISDSPVLQYNGAFVKQKATVIDYDPIINSIKDFSIQVTISCYVNNSGAYGASVYSDIAANATLSTDQKAQLQAMYGDRTVTYTTIGQCTDASGNIVACTAGGAIPEIQYWQTFKLNQIPGMGGSLSAQGAAAVQYLIIQAIVSKLDSRKKW